MIFFGIDPSLNACGYCAVSLVENRLIPLIFGTITPTKDAEFFDKLEKIYLILHENIQKFKPDYVAIEETFVNSNPKTSLKLGMVRGMCISATINAGINVKNIREYEARLIKKTITGSGNADKNQIAYLITKIISNFNPKTDDESDAAAVAVTCYMVENSPLNQCKKV